MKIETPEVFVESLSWMSINSEPDLKQWVNHVRSRDAAIRSESAALLKMCGEALKAAQSSMVSHNFSIIASKPLDQVSAALAALREAGVMV